MHIKGSGYARSHYSRTFRKLEGIQSKTLLYALVSLVIVMSFWNAAMSTLSFEGSLVTRHRHVAAVKQWLPSCHCGVAAMLPPVATTASPAHTPAPIPTSLQGYHGIAGQLPPQAHHETAVNHSPLLKKYITGLRRHVNVTFTRTATV